MTPIVTDTRSDWRERALETYREILADPAISDRTRNRARTQIYQLEREAPLLEWDGGGAP